MGIVLASLTALFWVWAALSGWYQLKILPDLGSGPPPPDPADGWPRVRLVAAARNEAQDVEQAVRSMLALDYPNLEVVLVDDRSTDETGAILERIAHDERATVAGEPRERFKVERVDELPAGWLGKNHALHIGARDAASEWLLFTDGDVRFHPYALRRAVGFAEERGLDHLALGPALLADSGLVKAFVSFFTLLFTVYIRPDKASDPDSPAHVGIGAFNLVRTSAYRAVGGHKRIAMRPDDDLKLGKLLKQHGFRQMAAPGRGLIEVYWYRTIGETVVGLEKNLFAGLEYSLPRALALGPPYLLFNFGPFLGPLFGVGSERILYGIALLALLSAAAASGRFATGSPLASAMGYPIAALLFLYIFLRAVYLTLRRGGIVWRESFYRLKELRRNRV